MKNRILSLILALCLALSLPAFSASAEEARLESAETKFSERIPTATVQARLAGGTDYLDKYGVTREKIVKELSAHEHDNYYLGTPFVGGDWQSPRGDTSYNGAPGTNCAGFVGYVLRKCGIDTKAVLNTMRSSSRFTCWGSGLAYDGLASASNYMSLAEKGKIVAYAYPTKAALLAGGKCEKGDIILRFWTDSWGGYDEDNHLMIFWGSTPHDDKVWQNASGRLHIGPMWSGDASSFIVIKFAPSKLSDSAAQTVPAVAGFEDIREKDWFAEAVKYVKQAGIMNGTGKKTFSPHAPTLRGQLVTILWGLSGRPEAALPGNFTDVEKSQYYSAAVDWAVESGIIAGYGDGRFGPDDPVTRQDLAVILYAYCNSRGYDTSAWKDLSGYSDVKEVGGYALEAMEWASGAGLINGTGGNSLSPKKTASRCETASVVMGLCERIKAGVL